MSAHRFRRIRTYGGQRPSGLVRGICPGLLAVPSLCSATSPDPGCLNLGSAFIDLDQDAQRFPSRACCQCGRHRCPVVPARPGKVSLMSRRSGACLAHRIRGGRSRKPCWYPGYRPWTEAELVPPAPWQVLCASTPGQQAVPALALHGLPRPFECGHLNWPRLARFSS